MMRILKKVGTEFSHSLFTYSYSTHKYAHPLSFPGIPSEKAWGKKKNVYYDADQHKEKDLGKFW